mgnify:CR=1 FL=1
MTQCVPRLAPAAAGGRALSAVLQEWASLVQETLALQPDRPECERAAELEDVGTRLKLCFTLVVRPALVRTRTVPMRL